VEEKRVVVEVKGREAEACDEQGAPKLRIRGHGVRE